MTRQTHLTLRLARAEATEIEAEAAASGVSVSAYVRHALQDRSRLNRQDRQELLQEVGEMLETKLAAIGERHAADLKTIADALANQVNRGYFIKVTQHLSKQLAAIMAHHKITLPRDET